MAKKTFEDSLAQLEQIVQELESGSLPLENALKKFEDGMKLSQFCEQKLDEIQKKVTLLIQHQDGQI
ncbi:MAG: exodeoxyribonuclease VII small subunit, partial [Desulfobacterales bacterium]|nr:exodeoxyribonuclease VII small subunit [Desulfobacterales bacterium]